MDPIDKMLSDLRDARNELDHQYARKAEADAAAVEALKGQAAATDELNTRSAAFNVLRDEFLGLVRNTFTSDPPRMPDPTPPEPVPVLPPPDLIA